MPLGTPSLAVYSDGKYQSFGYDDYGNKVWEENQLRQRTTYTYDAYKRLVKTKNPLRQGNQLQLRSHQW
jgi:YD repeat-containing protein